MNKQLASWFAIWHPRYRAVLVQLVLAGTLAAGLVYAQNSLLGLLTPSLALAFQEQPSSLASPAGALRALSDLSARLGLWLPLLILGLFILTRAVSAATEFWKAFATGALRIRTEDDLEAEVLLHLLRKDDAFFSRHSPAETVNRLGVDLYRVSDRRPELMTCWWSGLLIAGNLLFFFVRDWRLALVALAGCLAGAVWTQRMSRHVKALDADYLRQDDHIKSRFEDFLRAAPEVQVARLYEKIRHDFRGLQADRTRTFLKYVRLSALLTVGNIASALLAFVAMILVILYQLRTGVVSVALGLVPVVIWALPSVFQHASRLVFVHVQFQLARTSMNRLLEYEAHEAEGPKAQATEPIGRERDIAAGRPDEGAEPLRVAKATYRYTGPDGTPQGGVAEIDTAFVPGQWTAIVGGAGSGKSTLLKLLLGRLKAQAGQVLYGQSPVGAASDRRLARVLSIMPQSPALLDSTIRHNLLFGSPAAAETTGSAPELLEADLDVLERAGLGKLCRLKALDMTPGQPTDCPGLGAGIAEIRTRLRHRLQNECGAGVLPYEHGHSDRRHWLLECLLGGRCDRDRATAMLLGKSAGKKLTPLFQTALAAELVQIAQGLLHETRRLLGLANFQAYCQLAPFPLAERLWALRSSHADLAERSPASSRDNHALWVIALTSSPAEWASEDRCEKYVRGGGRGLPAEIGLLRALLGEACTPFALEEVHPHLTWRENLVFGVVETRSSRAGRRVDQAVLEFVEREGLKDAFTRLGLEYGIGRLGSNLSGGQGQLVALCRALLRRTPVVILDEPTSALDPASCARIAELLQTWKTGRVVITVSHDPAFIRQADQIKLMDGGRLVDCGTFEELKEGSEAFRRTLREI